MIHEISDESELPRIPMKKKKVFNLWGAEQFVKMQGIDEGWFLNVNYAERWLFFVDSVRCDGGEEEGDTHRRIK